MWSKESPVKEIAVDDASYETVSCDVLIVGAGGAGLRAAIESFDRGAKTVVVSKVLLGKAHTVMAEGGIAAALGNVDPEDSWKVHFSDTIVEGQRLSNWRTVEIYSKEVIDRVQRARAVRCALRQDAQEGR